MRVTVPTVHEDRVGSPCLYFVNEGWISYAVKMMAAGSVRYVVNEPVIVAIEEGDVPFNFGAKSMIEQGTVGRLRPGIEHAEINCAVC